jgi:hypothetical protein
MKIIENKIWKDGQKIGRIDGPHVRDVSDNKLGYFENNIIYNEAAHKIAYIHEDELVFENGQPSISLEHINTEIEGTMPLLAKCAVHVLFED